MTNNNDNVISMREKEGKSSSQEQVAKMERTNRCKMLLEQAVRLSPQNVVLIGVNQEGDPFVMDSEKSVGNVAYMTDIAKSMITSRAT